MKKLIFVLSILLLFFLCYSITFSLGKEYAPGRVVPGSPDWPDGLKELVNSESRFYGYMVNANDWFFFVGDSKDFNAFLKNYAALNNTPLTLVLHPGQGMMGRLGEREKNDPFDWKVNVLRRDWHPDATDEPEKSGSPYVVTLELWLGGAVRMEMLNVPDNVEVKSGGEMEQFVKTHNSRRRKSDGDGNTFTPFDGEQGVSVEGIFKLNMPTPLTLTIGTKTHPNYIRSDRIYLEVKESDLHAFPHLTWMTVEDAKWRIGIDLLDGKGSTLHHSEGVFSTRKKDSFGVALYEEATFVQKVGMFGAIEDALRFRYTISRATDDAPVTLTGMRQYTLKIRTHIDGEDIIHISDTSLWYEHRANVFPGCLHDSGEVPKENAFPTVINGAEWIPVWKGRISESYTALSLPSFGEEDYKITLSKIEGRGSVRIMERPGSGNSSSVLSLLISDSEGGAAWYEVHLDFTQVTSSAEHEVEQAKTVESGFPGEEEYETGERIEHPDRFSDTLEPAPEPPGPNTISIKTQIDGKDKLHIRDTSLWYDHLAWTLPGCWRSTGSVEKDKAFPTYINGEEWIPEWKENISEPYTGLYTYFPPDAEFKLNKISGRGSVRITEKPGENNDYTLTVVFDDQAGGAAWYHVEITW